ncbi:MAG: hypothetical protein ACRDUY_16450 [Nitriliruptorales bacterium]
MTLVFGLLAATAAIGVTMAWRHLRRQPVPLPAAVAHGAFAVTGFLTFTVILVVGVGITPMAVLAYAAMLVAGILGVVLITWHLSGDGRHPTALVAAHAALGLLVVLLLVAAVR